MSLGLLTSSLRVIKNFQLKENLDKARNLGLVSLRISGNDEDFSHLTQKKSHLQLVRLSAAVCGIEFCYAAETAFVSPTLLKIGIPVAYMSLMWTLSPILGFFLVPILGSLSDRCNLKFGRRRPFIALLSVGILAGLILVPSGKNIGLSLGDVYDAHIETWTNSSDGNLTVRNSTWNGETLNRHHPWSIVFTVVGVILLDFSCDACQSPCRAYLLDVTIPEDHSRGLSTFTVLAGLGGSLGYLMGGIDWERTSFGESFGGHVRVVFSMVFLIYLVFVSITLTTLREVPLSRLGVSKEDLQKPKKKKDRKKYRKFVNEDSEDEEEEATITNGEITAERQEEDSDTETVPNGIKRVRIVSDQTNYGSMTADHHVTDHMTSQGSHHDVEKRPESAPLPSEVSLGTYLKSILKMPRSIFILCLTNLFCWMSLVCYSLYFTDFVGQAVYGGDPMAPPGTTEHELYEAGVRMGSFGMSLYSLSCSIYSLNISRLVELFGAKRVYICSQLVYTVGMLIMSVWRHRSAVILLSPTAGIMYATLFTMPYILLAKYHSDDMFEEPTTDIPEERAHARGLGTDIALVSSMVFLAQFLLSLVIGSIVHVTKSTVSVVVAAALLSFCGALTATQVMYLDL